MFPYGQFREVAESSLQARTAQHRQDALRRLVQDAAERPDYIANAMWEELQPHIQGMLRERHSKEIDNIVQEMNYQNIREERVFWEIEARMVADPTQEVRNPPDMTQFQKYYSYPVLHMFKSMTLDQQQHVEGDLQRRIVFLQRQSRPIDYVELLRVHEQQAQAMERRQERIKEGTKHISWPAKLGPME